MDAIKSSIERVRNCLPLSADSRLINNSAIYNNGKSFIAWNADNINNNNFVGCTRNQDPFYSSLPPGNQINNNDKDNFWVALFDSYDDNDDDASDDGHSSMLSTAFLARKNRVTFDGSSDTTWFMTTKPITATTNINNQQTWENASKYTVKYATTI